MKDSIIKNPLPAIELVHAAAGVPMPEAPGRPEHYGCYNQKQHKKKKTRHRIAKQSRKRNRDM